MSNTKYLCITPTHWYSRVHFFFSVVHTFFVFSSVQFFFFFCVWVFFSLFCVAVWNGCCCRRFHVKRTKYIPAHKPCTNLMWVCFPNIILVCFGRLRIHHNFSIVIEKKEEENEHSSAPCHVRKKKTTFSINASLYKSCCTICTHLYVSVSYYMRRNITFGWKITTARN